MDRFIPKSKLSKKARRAQDSLMRRTWAIDPVTRRSKNKKAYDRNSEKREMSRDDGSFFIFPIGVKAAVRVDAPVCMRTEGVSQRLHHIHGRPRVAAGVVIGESR